MKKIMLACALVFMISTVAMAGGDKVRGSKGKGEVVQVVGP